MKKNAMHEITRFVYCATDVETGEQYIGSSACDSLEQLEDNHRRWKEKQYSDGPAKGTFFRRQLTKRGTLIQFEVLDRIENCTQPLIELIEEEWIYVKQPIFNHDNSPTASSSGRRRNDYTLAELNEAKGIYNTMGRGYTV